MKRTRAGGFTLLEVLVALAVLGVAITVAMQLFSADLRAIGRADDYVHALAKAEARMREVLASDDLSEVAGEERTNDGYRIKVATSGVLQDRTDNIRVGLSEVVVTVQWTSGEKGKSLSLRTMKVVKKKI